jgi:FtsH-binding integral membrane protein
MGSNDDSIGIWATIVWTALAFGVVALIALFSKFPG